VVIAASGAARARGGQPRLEALREAVAALGVTLDRESWYALWQAGQDTSALTPSLRRNYDAHPKATARRKLNEYGTPMATPVGGDAKNSTTAKIIALVLAKLIQFFNLLDLSIAEAIDEVVVHACDRLHVRVNDGRTNEN